MGCAANNSSHPSKAGADIHPRHTHMQSTQSHLKGGEKVGNCNPNLEVSRGSGKLETFCSFILQISIEPFISLCQTLLLLPCKIYCTFRGGLGLWFLVLHGTQGLAHAKPVLYHQSMVSIPPFFKLLF